MTVLCFFVETLKFQIKWLNNTESFKGDIYGPSNDRLAFHNSIRLNQIERLNVPLCALRTDGCQSLTQILCNLRPGHCRYSNRGRLSPGLKTDWVLVLKDDLQGLVQLQSYHLNSDIRNNFWILCFHNLSFSESGEKRHL